MAETPTDDLETKTRYARWSRLTSLRFLALMILAGILAGIVSTRMQHDNPALVRPIHSALVTVVGLLLAFSLVPVALSFRVYRKYRKTDQLIGAIGGAALVLGMFLNQLFPDDGAVAVAIYVLFAVSVIISIRGISRSKREIARLKAEATRTVRL